jgi:hypothetical protein
MFALTPRRWWSEDAFAISENTAEVSYDANVVYVGSYVVSKKTR